MNFKRARLAVFAVAAVALAGVFNHVNPASNADGAPLLLPTIADDVPDLWSKMLSEEAVDAGGIENNLDGNASALIASDPRQL